MFRPTRIAKTLAHWLSAAAARLLTAPLTRSPRTVDHRRRFRLGMDRMEDRDCPSIWLDITGDHEFGNPANWNDGWGPALTGTAWFIREQDGGSDDDCKDVTGTFNDFELVTGYPGTVTLSGSVTTASFAMGGGTLDQPAAEGGTDLTVTEFFSWHGGTINSTSNLANIILDGVAAGATIYGTVSLGSNINLTNGANATLGAGTITMTNGAAEIDVNDNCGMTVDPGPTATLKIEATSGLVLTGKGVVLKENTFLTIVSGGFNTGDYGLDNFGGTFTLMSGATARFQHVGKDGGKEYGYIQYSGQTVLQGGSITVLDSRFDGMLIKGGKLTTTDVKAEIWGDLIVTGGDVWIGGEGGYHDYSTLYVDGKVSWTGGTYHPYVSDGDTFADLWWATETFTVGGTATIAPGALDGESNLVIPASGQSWLVIEGDGGITGTVAVIPPAVFLLDPVPPAPGNPVTKWNVKSV